MLSNRAKVSEALSARRVLVILNQGGGGFGAIVEPLVAPLSHALLLVRLWSQNYARCVGMNSTHRAPTLVLCHLCHLCGLPGHVAPGIRSKSLQREASMHPTPRSNGGSQTGRGDRDEEGHKLFATFRIKAVLAWNFRVVQLKFSETSVRYLGIRP